MLKVKHEVCMRIKILPVLFLVSNYIFALCLEDACGSHPGMPNYLCADGMTMAGPGECVELPSGECVWEIVTCPEISMQGYLRSVEASFCMDACAEYYVESEIDAEFGYLNVISLNDDLDLYIDRFVNVETGEQFDCIECSAEEIMSIKISDECQYAVDCWVDPCEYAEECQVNIPTECIANYCGGCFADFYDLDGNLVDCYHDDCDPDLGCGLAITCCDGLLYPTTCCSNNCDAPIGECDAGSVECSDIDNPSECNSADCEWIGDSSDPWGSGQCVDVGFDDCHAYEGCDDCADAGCFWQTSQPWSGVGVCAEDCLIADMDCYGNAEDWIAECPEVTGCVDLSGLDFGECDMVLGIGYIDGECQYISGCDWLVDYTDYSDAFFDTMDICESACNVNIMTCDEISNTYEDYHSEEEYISCEFDNDCMAVWGHCDVGLGGCHYSVNEESYMEENINNLVDIWIDNDCMQGVCDCTSSPYAQCVDGNCSSAYCMNDNPAGCFQTGCEDGYECIISPNYCTPSWCECSGFYGEWYCTEDCGGGTCVASFQVGDMNSDGSVNVVDIVLAVQFILGGEYNPLGDMNNDNLFNVVDVVIMLNVILDP